MLGNLKKKIISKRLLRIGINMSNFLLVNQKNKFSDPQGLSPDIGKLLAKELNVKYKFLLFKNPGELTDSTSEDKWDVGNFAYERKRAQIIDFSRPYVNIDANFLVSEKNQIDNNKEVDSKYIKIAVVNRSAYDLWLSDNFKNAEIIRAKTINDSHKLFDEGKADVLAGLRPKLIEEMSKNNNLKIIQKPFTFIKQSIGIKKGNEENILFINKFISKIIIDGTIKKLLVKHKLQNKLTIPS